MSVQAEREGAALREVLEDIEDRGDEVRTCAVLGLQGSVTCSPPGYTDILGLLRVQLSQHR